VLKTHPFIPTSRRLIIVPLGGGAAALEDARFRGIARPIQRALPAGSVASNRQRARALTPNAIGFFVGEREASL